MPSDTNGYPADFAKMLELFNGESDLLMERLKAGKLTPAKWRIEMSKLLAKYGQSAMMLGLGSLEVDSGRLSIWLKSQLEYLGKFATVVSSSPDYSPAWESRARMYGASTYTEYWEGKTEGLPLPAQPGQQCQCKSNCKCEWSIKWIDKKKGSCDAYWKLDEQAEHCQTCLTRHEMWNPVRIRNGNLQT